MFIIVLIFMCSFVHVFLCMSMPMCCSCFMRVFMLGCLSVYVKNLYVCLFSQKAEVESGHIVEQTGRKLGMVHGSAYQAKRADFASPQAHSGSLETSPEEWDMAVILHEHMLFMSLQTCLHVVNHLPRTSHHDEWLFIRAISSEKRNRHVGSYHKNQTTPGTVDILT